MERRTRIYLDESGYTGDDLLDPDQTVFAIATHSFSDSECSDLVAQHFGRVRAAELKHVELKRRPAYRKAIVGFLEAMNKHTDKVKFGFAHKRYALTLKLVDLGVEPSLYRAGFDIYRTDFFRTFGNLLYFVLQSGESDSLSPVLAAFQQLADTRSAEALAALRTIVQTPTGKAVHDEVLSRLRGPIADLRPSEVSAMPVPPLDLSLTAALQCFHAWRASGHSRMEVHHDRSSNMASQRHLWDALVSPAAPPARVGYGAEPVEFPIGVEETHFVNSRTSRGIQLADVLAGALARWAGWLDVGRPPGDEYAAAMDPVFEELCEPCFAWIMWPDPDVTPQLTSPDLGDYLEYVGRIAATANTAH